LSKTHENYNLAAFQTLPQAEFMNKCLGQLKIFKRDDVKYLCDWTVTLPRGMEHEKRRFFDEVFLFLTDKYKQENVVSAYVHKDENQPHMHFAFIPVAMNKKKNVEKLCSKAVVNRDELLSFHDELDAHLTKAFGYDTGIKKNGATKEGNKSIDELKRETAIKELREKKEELNEVTDTIDRLKWPQRIKPIKEKNDTVIISKSDLQSANAALLKSDRLETEAKDAKEILKKISTWKTSSLRMRTIS
jgi:hypothetical protein